MADKEISPLNVIIACLQTIRWGEISICASVAHKYTCKVELVENAAWGKLSTAWWWALLEAPQETGPVHQLHDCSIARDFWTLSFVFAVTLCCTDSIWKGWKMRFRFLQQRSTLRSPHWCFSSHDYRGIFSCCYLALTLLIQLCSDKCKIEDIIFLKRGHNFAETEGAERHEILLMLWSKPSDDYAPGTKHSLINYSKVYNWPKPTTIYFVSEEEKRDGDNVEWVFSLLKRN